MRVRLWKLRFQLLRNGAHGVLCHLQPGLWLEPAYHIQPAGSAVGPFFFCQNERNPDTGSSHQREVEIFRHHANYGVTVAIQQNCFAVQIGIAVESFMPESITDERYLAHTRLVFFRAEVSADYRLDLESTEEIRAHAVSRNSL